MASSQVQEQHITAGIEQTQTITQRQYLLAQLMELPLAQLADRINTEANDNPAIEIDRRDDGYDGDEAQEDDNPADYTDGDDYESARDRQDRQDAFNDALARMGGDDDELPVYHGGSSSADGDLHPESVATQSFYEQLYSQFADIDIDNRQRTILEYLIGSLDDDGLLRKPLGDIADEMALKLNIDATDGEIERVLGKLQQLDPAGVGGRSLQECLLLQIERRPDSNVKTLMRKVVADKFDLFANRRWEQIARSLKLSDAQADAIERELRKLNPKPGASLGGNGSEGAARQVVPDFIVDTSDDGIVTFTLNSGELPAMRVSQSFVDSMKAYGDGDKSKKVSRQVREAMLYTKAKVEAARTFIDVVRERNRTLRVTMAAIIRWQRDFFIDGDEASLRPMRLKDIADVTGLDLSTISRVSRDKYAQTRWGIFQLKYFFVDNFAADRGEQMATTRVKGALRDIVDGEDKCSPLTDDDLKAEMDRRGFPIARRTVTKYREAMGIPTARLRKK